MKPADSTVEIRLESTWGKDGVAVSSVVCIRF